MPSPADSADPGTSTDPTDSTTSSDPTDSPQIAQGRLRTVLRTSLVPFFAALFPTVHYLARSLSSGGLSPSVDSTAATYALWGLAALVASAGVGLTAGLLVYWIVVEPSADKRGVTAHPDDSLFWRALLLDGRTAHVYLGFVAVIGIWAVVTLGGVGSESLATLLSFIVLPFGLPLLLLAPVAIASHVGVIVGYAACAVWIALLARLFVERVIGVEEPQGDSDRSPDETDSVGN